MRKTKTGRKEKGQILVIMAIAMAVLLIFIGLAIDGSQLFLNYTRLKRAVDAGVVAAANDFKKDGSLTRMKESALEILGMQQVSDSVDVQIYTCESANIDTLVPEFYAICPKPGQDKKKLVYLRAFENSPTYFVSLIGIHSVPITTSSIAEAAPVDLVIVLDTSESMGRNTPGFYDNNGDFNPASCNASNTCEPLRSAKDAAKTLINPLYPGYDKVAIVTFDTTAQVRYNLGDPTGALSVLDNLVPLHDDPPSSKLFPNWDNYGNNKGRFNPINPEDRNGDGSDDDTSTTSTQCAITDPAGDRWDSTSTPNRPCDLLDTLDAFDWTDPTIFSTGTGAGYACTPVNSDTCLSQRWLVDHNPVNPSTGTGYDPPLPMSLVSTCTGCGVRMAASVLTASGRTNAVWVMVFLSDGAANMSDTPQTFPYSATTQLGVKSSYPNGYCNGQIDLTGTWNPAANPPNYWLNYCQDDTGIRHCINNNSATCPTGSVYGADPNKAYSVLDYAKDMIDVAALRVSTNANEKPIGNDMAIYTIMFGADIAPKGAPLLRYMAAVGDDGDRSTDPCAGYSANPTQSCGQYYFAADSNALEKVFRDIASRIYTKISE
jgi:hypothetical protein